MAQEIERVNWPEKSGEYPIVQFDKDNGEKFIQFARSPTKSHAVTVCDFVRKAKLDLMYPDDIEALEKYTSYKIVGAGKCKYDVGEKSAEFFGRSKGYNIPIDSDHLESIAEDYPDHEITLRK